MTHAASRVDLEHVRTARRFAKNAKPFAAGAIAPRILVFFRIGLGANDGAELNQLEGETPVSLVLLLAPAKIDCLPDVDALAIKQ